MSGERRTGALRPEQPITGLFQLALFLGGSDDSFTGDLLRLIMKADLGNRVALGGAYPHQMAALKLWMARTPAPTAGELAAALEAMQRIDGAAELLLGNVLGSGIEDEIWDQVR